MCLPHDNQDMLEGIARGNHIQNAGSFGSRLTSAACFAMILFISPMMKTFSFTLFSLLIALSGSAVFSQTSETDDRLRKGLERYPEADRDGDGVLTMEEARAYLKQRKEARPSSSRDAGGSPELPPNYANVSYGPHERNRLD